MKFIDSHCHLNSKMFKDDIDQVIRNAKSKGMEYCIISSGTVKNIPDSIKLTEKYKECYASIGLSPRYCQNWQNEIQYIREYAKNPKIVALGEIGLDYMFNVKTSREIQMEALNAHFNLASELNLPVVLHTRNTQTYLDEFDLIKKSPISGNEHPGVLHGFNADYDIAKKAIDLGLYQSFGGRLAYNNAKKMPALVKKLPLDYILVETDAPCTPPDPYRKQSIRSEPSHLKVIIEKIAHIHGKDPEEIADITTKNAKKIFNLN